LSPHEAEQLAAAIEQLPAMTHENVSLVFVDFGDRRLGVSTNEATKMSGFLRSASSFALGRDHKP